MNVPHSLLSHLQKNTTTNISYTHLVGHHIQRRQILDDVLLELIFLLARVGVIEAHQQAALVALRVVLVQQHSLGVTNVKVPGGLRREARAHLALDGALQRRAAAQRTTLLLLFIVRRGGGSGALLVGRAAGNNKRNDGKIRGESDVGE